MIIIIVLYLFDKLKFRLISFGITILFLLLNGVNSNFEAVKVLEDYDVNLMGDVSITTFTATKKGHVELIPHENSYNIKLFGQKGGKYTFELTDEVGNIYNFEYYYDNNENTIVLNRN